MPVGRQIGIEAFLTKRNLRTRARRLQFWNALEGIDAGDDARRKEFEPEDCASAFQRADLQYGANIALMLQHMRPMPNVRRRIVGRKLLSLKPSIVGRKHAPVCARVRSETK